MLKRIGLRQLPCGKPLEVERSLVRKKVEFYEKKKRPEQNRNINGVKGTSNVNEEAIRNSLLLKDL